MCECGMFVLFESTRITRQGEDWRQERVLIAWIVMGENDQRRTA